MGIRKSNDILKNAPELRKKHWLLSDLKMLVKECTNDKGKWDQFDAAQLECLLKWDKENKIILKEDLTDKTTNEFNEIMKLRLEHQLCL